MTAIAATPRGKKSTGTQNGAQCRNAECGGGIEVFQTKVTMVTRAAVLYIMARVEQEPHKGRTTSGKPQGANVYIQCPQEMNGKREIPI